MPTNKGTALPLPPGHPLPSSALEEFEDSGIGAGTSLRPAQFPAHLEVRLLCHSSPAPRECQMTVGQLEMGRAQEAGLQAMSLPTRRASISFLGSSVSF